MKAQVTKKKKRIPAVAVKGQTLFLNREGCRTIPTISKEHDAINHPFWYCQNPGGIECIQVTEHMNFNLGNAVKYLWRAGIKSSVAWQDLAKAQWYIDREIQRLSR